MKNKIANRLFFGALGGIAIGYFMTIGISLALGDGAYHPCVPALAERYGSEVVAVMIQTALSAALGAAFSGGSVVWEMENWSLMKQTVVYFGIVAVAQMTAAYICEWMERSVKGVLIYAGVFLVIFAVIWIIEYMIWKARISRLNGELKKMN